ncbi:MAG: formylglycine-generating enzyme family protein, partial [Chloroflexi bacterium]|nr:formylglycine-generating enzyme family protein [Chloroflexota bacterium]
PGATRIAEKDGMVMVYVPAGTFEMGSNEGDSDEQPVHAVTLDAFWIDQTEVTSAMFRIFVEATGYETDAEKAGWSYVFNPSSASWEQTNGADWAHPRGPSSGLSGLEKHPVINVSWNDATAYCEWADRRLPTEAEWEKAARGDDGRKYPWGNGNVAGNLLDFADSNLNVDWADKTVDDGYQFTAPVGSYPDGASPYGALDIAGNVWEWVNDWYSENYYNTSPTENPPGPSSGDYRVLRGGSWYNEARNVRASGRLRFFPDFGGYDLGFRCSR